MAHPRPIGLVPSGTITTFTCPDHFRYGLLRYLASRGKIIDEWSIAGFNCCIKFRGNIDAKEIKERFPGVTHVE